MGYTASCTIETYVIRDDVDREALGTPGWQKNGKFTLNTAGEFVFTISDSLSLEILFTLIGCKLSTEAVQFPARGLNTKSTTWRVARILPGLKSF